jgi:hypothetical protein
MSSARKSSYFSTIGSREEAISAMHYGAYAAMFTVVANTVASIASMILRHPVLGIDGWGLVDAAIAAIVAWRIFKLSLPWACVGFLLFASEKIYGLASNPAAGSHGVIVALILLVAYINAIRGGQFLRKRSNLPVSAVTDSSLPIV